MTSINPQPEPSPPIVKPRKDETLRSWLTRKNHARMFFMISKLPSQDKVGIMSWLGINEREQYETKAIERRIIC